MENIHWFNIEIISDEFYGFKKGQKIFARKDFDGFKIFDGINEPYNQSICRISLEEMRQNVKTLRDNEKVIYVDINKEKELNKLDKILSDRLFY